MENDKTDGANSTAAEHAAAAAAKPVINDVKLVNRDQLAGSFTLSRYATTRGRQRTLRARLEPGRSSDDSCLTEMPSTRPSSTFNDLPQSVLVVLVVTVVVEVL